MSSPETSQPAVSTDGMGQVVVDCDSCEWELTLSDMFEKIENDNTSLGPTPSRIRSKMGSLGEGHAYFNRGHTIETHLSRDEIEDYLDTGANRGGDL